jgi:hypothetical protein
LKLVLKVGHRTALGQKGTAHAYNLKSHRDQGRRWVEQAEAAYAALLAAGTQWAESAHGRRKGGATIKVAWQGSHLVPCSSPRRHQCATGGYQDRRRKRLWITSVICARYGTRSRGWKPQCRAKSRKPDGSGVDRDRSRAAPGRPCAYCRRAPRAARRRNQETRSRAPRDIGRAVFQGGKSRTSCVREAAAGRKSCRELASFLCTRPS